MFMPVGKDPFLELVPTPQQRLECGARFASLRQRFPIFLADFWNEMVPELLIRRPRRGSPGRS